MSNDDYYRIADELRGIASRGLVFTENEYDRERYTRVLALSARLVAIMEKRVPDEVMTQYRDNLGYVSPIIGAEAVVWRDGKLLLIRRSDDGLWALPGGLTEVGENWAESAARELWEEAGVRGQVTQLLGMFDSRVWRTRTRMQLYTSMFRIESEDTPAAGPETCDAQFFAKDELPPLSQGHDLRVPFAFQLVRGDIPIPYFDKFGPTSRIDPRLEVHVSPLEGKGMFAKAPIRCGETVVVWGGTLFTAQEIAQGRAAKHSCAAIGENLYLGSAADEGNSPDDFMNHSCDPNVGMRDQVTLVARRNVAAGEELTIDYAMFEGDENWVADWECHCGTPFCRKKITGQDWRRQDLQARYENHFSPFILRRIRKMYVH